MLARRDLRKPVLKVFVLNIGKKLLKKKLAKSYGLSLSLFEGKIILSSFQTFF